MHKAKKKFGQNFLQQADIIERIVRSGNYNHDDNLIEIGPGLGALTKPLLSILDLLTVIEVDNDIINNLKSYHANLLNKMNIVHTDALKFDYSSLAINKKIRLIGNLPYNISTPLLFHLIEHISNILDMTFMLQEEVVDRMVAEPNCKDYGKLTIMIKYFCDTEKLFTVSPTAFKPVPKVTSAIVKLTPHIEQKYYAKDFKFFKEIVSTAFNLRRKTIGKSLGNLFSKEELIELNIEPSLRPENLSIDQFLQLANSKTRT